MKSVIRFVFALALLASIQMSAFSAAQNEKFLANQGVAEMLEQKADAMLAVRDEEFAETYFDCLNELAIGGGKKEASKRVLRKLMGAIYLMPPQEQQQALAFVLETWTIEESKDIADLRNFVIAAKSFSARRRRILIPYQQSVNLTSEVSSAPAKDPQSAKAKVECLMLLAQTPALVDAARSRNILSVALEQCDELTVDADSLRAAILRALILSNTKSKSKELADGPLLIRSLLQYASLLERLKQTNEAVSLENGALQMFGRVPPTEIIQTYKSLLDSMNKLKIVSYQMPLYLGLAYDAAGQHEKARAEYDQAIAPKSSGWPAACTQDEHEFLVKLSIARNSILQSNDKEAINNLLGVIDSLKLSQSDYMTAYLPLAQALLASVYFKQGRYSDALPLLQEANFTIARNLQIPRVIRERARNLPMLGFAFKSDEDILRDLIAVLAKLGRTEDAQRHRAELDKLIAKVDPNDELYRLRSELHEAIELNPEHAHQLVDRMIAFCSSNFEDATVCESKLVELGEDSMKSSQLQSARKCFRTAIEISEKAKIRYDTVKAQACVDLAWLDILNGDSAAAETKLGLALQSVRPDNDVAVRLAAACEGSVQLHKSAFHEAQSRLEPAVHRFPIMDTPPRALLQQEFECDLAEAYMKQGKYAQAQAVLMRVLKPNHARTPRRSAPRAASLLSLVFFKTGHPALARTTMKQAGDALESSNSPASGLEELWWNLNSAKLAEWDGNTFRAKRYNMQARECAHKLGLSGGRALSEISAGFARNAK
jgi:tetratricopeptide (TPR) repeat protein